MNKNTYFISDLHLGLPDKQRSKQREKKIVALLDELQEKAQTIYFVGDIFDFWWEYKYVVPRGYLLFFSKIIQLTSAGVEVHFFTGNHDIWMKDYLPEELGIRLHTSEYRTTINGKKFFIAHGDGLGSGDKSYKILKKIFTNSFLQWCFSRLHPNFAFALARFWSKSGRKKEKFYYFLGEEKEHLISYAKQMTQKEDLDFLVFGHRHFPLILPLTTRACYANSGDWLVHFSFLEFTGSRLLLRTYKDNKIENMDSDIHRKTKISIF